MHRPGMLIVVLTAALTLALPLARADTGQDDSDIAVRVQKVGPAIVIDVEAPVRATVADAWSVLTDYDHMADFVSNLKSSRVLRRDGNRLEVEQIGEAHKGPLRFPFKTIRSVELVPYHEIRSRLIKGEFQSYEFTTRIRETPTGVTIINHGAYVPNAWVPPIIGPAMIESETRKQYGELRAEMLRRQKQANAARP